MTTAIEVRCMVCRHVIPRRYRMYGQVYRARQYCSVACAGFARRRDFTVREHRSTRADRIRKWLQFEPMTISALCRGLKCSRFALAQTLKLMPDIARSRGVDRRVVVSLTQSHSTRYTA